ncbi:MAG: pantetheine-phosphate adenylyltransferase [Candidatus Izemoplasma sp.]
MSKAVYPGSFDPITFGHIDIIRRALKVFDKLYILISKNVSKDSMFTAEERVVMLKIVLKDCLDKIEIIESDQLTVKHAKDLGATHIVRGLRAVTDFEYEFQMTSANRVLEKDIDNVFFMTDNKYSFLSSTTVKEIAHFRGDLDAFVPKVVIKMINEKLK